MISTGLHGDAAVLERLLSGEYNCTVQPRLFFDLTDRASRRLVCRIHLEHVYFHLLLPRPASNLWLPNQEFVTAADLQALPRLDLIWAKTLYAYRLLRQCRDRRCPVLFGSFCSPAPVVTAPVATLPLTRWRRCLHLAGASWLKNTGAVVRAWARHPEWPPLTLVCRDYCARQHHRWLQVAQQLPHVKVIGHCLPRAAIDKLLLSHGVHLVCSETEGWGHYIHEAQAAAACCLFTDAAPVNEFFVPGAGLPVPVSADRRAPMGSMAGSTACRLQASDIEDGMKTLLTMSLEARRAMGLAAQQLFQGRQVTFWQRRAPVVRSAIRHAIAYK